MTNVKDVLKLLRSVEIVSLLNQPPIFWVALCDYLQVHRDPEVLALFIGLANTLVQRGIWHRILLKCLQSGNFHFVKQFFYYAYEPLPRYLTAVTLAQLQIAFTNVALAKEWADEGFANAILWDSVHFELWNSPSFNYVLFNPAIDPNLPDPHSGKIGRAGLPRLTHAFFDTPSVEWCNIPSFCSLSSSALSEELSTQGLHAYQSQLMLLERENQTRLVNQDNRTTPLIWAVAHGKLLLVDTILKSPRTKVNAQDVYSRTPLMYAIAIVDVQIVKRLLACSDIDLNVRDSTGRSAIFYASQAGDLSITKSLIQTAELDLHIRDSTGQSALNYAQACGYHNLEAALSVEEGGSQKRGIRPEAACMS